MRKQRSIPKILRRGVPSFKVKNEFTLPVSNRYFSKVLKNPNAISQSSGDISTDLNENKSSALNRSVSFSLSRKMSKMNESIP